MRKSARAKDGVRARVRDGEQPGSREPLAAPGPIIRVRYALAAESRYGQRTRLLMEIREAARPGPGGSGAAHAAATAACGVGGEAARGLGRG